MVNFSVDKYQQLLPSGMILELGQPRMDDDLEKSEQKTSYTYSGINPIAHFFDIFMLVLG